MTEQEFLTELLRIQSLPQENWSIELYQLECKCREENCTYLLSLPEYTEFQKWAWTKVETRCRIEKWTYDTNFIPCFKGSIYSPSIYNNGDIVIGDDDGTLYMFFDDKFINLGK